MEKLFDNCKVCSSPIQLINTKNQLVKCENCKLVFCNKIYVQKDFVKLYNELYNSSNPQYSIHSIKEYQSLLEGKINIGYNRKRIIDKNLDRNDSILEIGSGIGLIGFYLKKRLKIKNYIGVEIDKESVKKALSLGVNTIHGDFKQIDNFTTKFDKIMIWEVLEHIQDLGLFMELVYKVLKPGGKIIISVPNFDKRKNFSDQTKIYQSGPPIHLNFFTNKSLNNIFKLYNFSDRHLTTKKLPYFELKLKYLINCVKYLTGKYHGSTIYFTAIKS